MNCVIFIIFLSFEFILITLSIGVFLGIFFDAPFIKTKKKTAKKMIDFADLKKDDVVFDLGCGDGSFMKLLEGKVKKIVGIEISFPIYVLGVLRKYIKHYKWDIRFGNIFHQKDIFKADVIFMYLSPWGVNRFYKKVYPSLKVGTRVVSNTFYINNLKVKRIFKAGKKGRGDVYLYEKEK